MCFAFDARPPDLPADLARPPIAGAAGAELLELTSADGTRFSGALAEAPDPAGRAVVILPDVRGLYPFYSELAERTGAGAASTVGFCFGGTQSFLAATNAELGLEGVVGFYGGLNPERWGDMSPIHRAGDMRGPVLGLYGGDDAGIPPEQVDAFERGLADAGVEHEIVTYPGAPHSFFDRRYEEHAEACADAWRRVLSFL